MGEIAIVGSKIVTLGGHAAADYHDPVSEMAQRFCSISQEKSAYAAKRAGPIHPLSGQLLEPARLDFTERWRRLQLLSPPDPDVRPSRREKRL